MKNYKKAIMFLLVIFTLSIANAETTFFEGDYFILGEIQLDGGGGCSSLWICEEWSSCSSGIRERSCTDINTCSSVENPPLLLSCSEAIPNRISGCVTFQDLDVLIKGWKLDIYRFDLLDEGIAKWKNNIDC